MIQIQAHQKVDLLMRTLFHNRGLYRKLQNSYFARRPYDKLIKS